MNKPHLLLILALFAAPEAVHASATLDVLVDGRSSSSADPVDGDGILDISIVLNRNGSTDGFFSGFSGWSQFGGSLVHNIPGAVWIAPDESAGVQSTTTGEWQGRRPPSQVGFPGGAYGGFRFNPDTSTTSSMRIDGIAGIAASSTLGGFLHDGSGSLEVFRAQLDVTGINQPGNYSISLDPSLLQIFFGGFQVERAVLDEVVINGVEVGYLIPAPGSLAVLGAAGFCSVRRRR